MTDFNMYEGAQQVINDPIVFDNSKDPESEIERIGSILAEKMLLMAQLIKDSNGHHIVADEFILEAHECIGKHLTRPWGK